STTRAGVDVSAPCPAGRRSGGGVAGTVAAGVDGEEVVEAAGAEAVGACGVRPIGAVGVASGGGAAVTGTGAPATGTGATGSLAGGSGTFSGTTLDARAGFDAQAVVRAAVSIMAPAALLSIIPGRSIPQARGISIRNSVPRPSVDCTSISPPCSCATR